ncbi:MAG: hypothetical protein AAF806_20640 [Bacteroidota bacterium]
MSNQKSFKEILQSEDFGSMVSKTGIIVLVIFLSSILLIKYSENKYLGKEVARLVINDLSTKKEQAMVKDTSLFLQAGTVLELWSEMSIKYKDTFQLNYHIEIPKDDLPYQSLDIDPVQPSFRQTSSYSNSIFTQKSSSFNARYVQLTIPEDATYTFRGNLINLGAVGVSTEQAEIVLRYPPKKE